MSEGGKPWPWRLSLAGGLVALVLLALNPLVVRYEDVPVATPVNVQVAAEAIAAECEITGLADYGIQHLQAGACSPHVYVRACRDAQLAHRERCQEFCGALKDVGGSQSCRGVSRPVAQLFDPAHHCREILHEQFEVTCRVNSACSCVPTPRSSRG